MSERKEKLWIKCKANLFYYIMYGNDNICYCGRSLEKAKERLEFFKKLYKEAENKKDL